MLNFEYPYDGIPFTEEDAQAMAETQAILEAQERDRQLHRLERLELDAALTRAELQTADRHNDWSFVRALRLAILDRRIKRSKKWLGIDALMTDADNIDRLADADQPDLG